MSIDDLISSLRRGAPIVRQLSADSNFLINSWRVSFDSPVCNIFVHNSAIKLWMAALYDVSAGAPSPNKFINSCSTVTD